jgi:hypothetical protein
MLNASFVGHDPNPISIELFGCGMVCMSEFSQFAVLRTATRLSYGRCTVDRRCLGTFRRATGLLFAAISYGLIGVSSEAAPELSPEQWLQQWLPQSDIERQVAKAFGYFIKEKQDQYFRWSPSCHVMVISSDLILTDGCAAMPGYLGYVRSLALGGFRTYWGDARSYYQFDNVPIERGDGWALFTVTNGDPEKDYGAVTLATRKPELGESIFLIQSNLGVGGGETQFRHGCYVTDFETGPRFVFTCGDPIHFPLAHGPAVEFQFSLDGALIGILYPKYPNEPYNQPDRGIATAVSEITKESRVLTAANMANKVIACYKAGNATVADMYACAGLGHPAHIDVVFP